MKNFLSIMTWFDKRYNRFVSFLVRVHIAVLFELFLIRAQLGFQVFLGCTFAMEYGPYPTRNKNNEASTTKYYTFAF